MIYRLRWARFKPAAKVARVVEDSRRAQGRRRSLARVTTEPGKLEPTCATFPRWSAMVPPDALVAEVPRHSGIGDFWASRTRRTSVAFSAS